MRPTFRRQLFAAAFATLALAAIPAHAATPRRRLPYTPWIAEVAAMATAGIW